MKNKILKIKDNIYAVRGIWLWHFSFFPTYCYIIQNKKNGEIILIDTCGPGTSHLIKEAIEFMGGKATDITAIALTHWHQDHTGSICEIATMIGKRDKPLKIFIHYRDADFLISQKLRWLNIHPFLKIKVCHKPGKLPSNELYELVPFGNSNNNPLSSYGIDFIHSPGHTPGHSAYLYKEDGILFSECGLSILGKKTVGIVPVFYNRKEQIESAKKLAQMDFKYLYPAHLYLNHKEISKGKRVACNQKSFINRIFGSLPLFKYMD